MGVLRILTVPNPVLNKVSSPIGEINFDIKKLVFDMIDTMHNQKHCIGLSAPQVGENLRIIVFDVSLYHKAHPNHGQIVLINPFIKHYEGKRIGREGCLSVPDFTGNVTRAQKIVIEGLDQNNKLINIEASDFEAVVIQHEVDHLDGIIFLDRVSSLKTDIFRRRNI